MSEGKPRFTYVVDELDNYVIFDGDLMLSPSQVCGYLINAAAKKDQCDCVGGGSLPCADCGAGC